MSSRPLVKIQSGTRKVQAYESGRKIQLSQEADLLISKDGYLLGILDDGSIVFYDSTPTKYHFTYKGCSDLYSFYAGGGEITSINPLIFSPKLRYTKRYGVELNQDVFLVIRNSATNVSNDIFTGGKSYEAGWNGNPNKYCAAKFNSGGTFQWGYAGAGLESDPDYNYWYGLVNAICIDSAGNIYLAGIFSWEKMYQGQFYRHLWNVVKLNSSGVFQAAWRLYSGDSYQVWTEIYDMEIDAEDNLYCVGKRYGNKSIWKVACSNLSLIWDRDTGDDLRGIAQDGVESIYVCGKRVSGYSAWCVDYENTLVWSYDSGANLNDICIRWEAGVRYIYLVGVKNGLGYNCFKLQLTAEGVWVYGYTIPYPEPNELLGIIG